MIESKAEARSRSPVYRIDLRKRMEFVPKNSRPKEKLNHESDQSTAFSSFFPSFGGKSSAGRALSLYQIEKIGKDALLNREVSRRCPIYDSR